MQAAWAWALAEPLTSQPAVGTGAASDGVGWSRVAVVILAMTLLHVLLGWLARRGVLRYPARRLGRGLGRAVMTFGHFLQPNIPPPEDRPDDTEMREDDGMGRQPDPDVAGLLSQDGRWPDDGLRTRLPDGVKGSRVMTAGANGPQ